MSEPSFDMETIEGRLFDAAYRGDAESLGSQLDAHPERLGTRLAPYDWSLLHVAAHRGHLEAVELLLRRGLDVNARERGDNARARRCRAAPAHRGCKPPHSRHEA